MQTGLPQKMYRYGRQIVIGGYRGLLLDTACLNYANVSRGYLQVREGHQTHHSLQNRKVICSVFLGASPELEAGEAILFVS